MVNRKMNKQILSHQPSPIQPSSDQPSLAQLSESSKVKLEKSNARGKKYREIIKKNEINGSLLASTTPLLVCGKEQIYTRNNERREKFM